PPPRYLHPFPTRRSSDLPLGGGMPSFRGCLAALLCASLIAAPSWSAPVNALGTVVAADRAHLSDTAASPGATVFSGDRVNTEAGDRKSTRLNSSHGSISY